MIIDLEDAVGPEGKGAAREAAATWLRDNLAFVRVNAVGTRWHVEDLESVVGCRGLAGVVLPKAESVDELRAVIAALPTGRPVHALIETARGVRDAAGLAETPGVGRLMFGNLDFSLDAGITVRTADEAELRYARSSIVVASRAAGLPGPVDGVTTDLSDGAALRAATERGRDLGFAGKLCIHPRQLEIVHAAFRPSAEELAWARRVVEAAGEQPADALAVDGELIDTPQWARAHRILRSARRDPDPT